MVEILYGYTGNQSSVLFCHTKPFANDNSLFRISVPSTSQFSVIYFLDKKNPADMGIVRRKAGTILATLRSVHVEITYRRSRCNHKVTTVQCNSQSTAIF